LFVRGIKAFCDEKQARKCREEHDRPQQGLRIAAGTAHCQQENVDTQSQGR